MGRKERRKAKNKSRKDVQCNKIKRTLAKIPAKSTNKIQRTSVFGNVVCVAATQGAQV